MELAVYIKLPRGSYMKQLSPRACKKYKETQASKTEKIFKPPQIYQFQIQSHDALLNLLLISIFWISVYFSKMGRNSRFRLLQKSTV